MSTLRNLRIVSFIEGISTLLLFLVAMPLKYVAGKPEMVTIVGRAHGGLVIAFCIFLWLAMRARKWEMEMVVKMFVASLFPFGFLWIDKVIKSEE